MPITRGPTGEMLLPASNKKETEYHQNMDRDVFMKWFKRRLPPAFPDNYGEVVILIVDNAAYHGGMVTSW